MTFFSWVVFLPQKTALHYAAENDRLDIVKLLLDRGAQVDGRVEGMWAGLFARTKTKMVNSFLIYTSLRTEDLLHRRRSVVFN